MKVFLIPVLVPVMMMFFVCNSYSQDSTKGKWSLMVQGGFGTNFGVSDALRGDASTFKSEIMTNGNYSKLPFGEDGASSMGIYQMLIYKLPSSNFSLYARYGIAIFLYDNGSTGSIVKWDNNYQISDIIPNRETVSFSSQSLTLGAEYTLGNETDLFNLFFRAGIGFHLINANLDYYDFSTSTYFGARGGLELELGGRINIPGTPLAIELSTAYVNSNLIGKSYDGPNITNLILGKPYINDGAGGGYGNKIFDFLSFRIGIKIYF